ncbi:MAG: hypothetical protein ABRQ25_17755 [Clostridiaceae bacterium]
MEEGSFDISRGMDYEDSVYEDFYLGKNIMSSRMAQNDKYLFFGEVNYKPGENTALDIRIMNKGSKEVKNINLPIENNDYGFTQAVGILGSKGIVSVSIQDKKNFKVSTRIYSFNLETGEKINELSVDKNLHGNNISSKTEDGYIILMSEANNGNGKNLNQSNELFLYDIKQDKYKIIDLKDINTYKLAAVGTLDDLYLIDTDILKVYKVDVEKNSTEEKGTIALENGAQISEAVVSKERMYIAGERGVCNSWINVYNIEGMKKLYEGEIKEKNGIAMSGVLELNLLNQN